jgi:DNA-binding transcriptional ArsR family regulator
MGTAKVLQSADAIAAATHPVRAAILDAMREPATAAAVARRVGQTRQNVAYHVRELEKAGLLRRVGERRNGNFVEQLYVADAATLVIAPASTWGDAARRTAALADQLSLGELVRAGEQLQRESALLLDRAAFDGEEIPSASVATDIRFSSEEARAAFLRECVEAIGALAQKHGARDGDAYRVLLAAYPDPEPS